jgi:hypothetical protein
MTENALLTLLSIVMPILTGMVGYFYGKQYERKRQELILRAETLKPLEEWLRGVERMVGIVGDTFTSIAVMNSPSPVFYDLNERQEIAKFLSEKSNQVFGILNSKSIQTTKTKKDSIELRDLIFEIDQKIKNELLPLDYQMTCTPIDGIMPLDLQKRVAGLKQEFDKSLQSGHSLITSIRLNLN